MISATPYEDFAAMAVFRDLDRFDMSEAIAMRSSDVSYLGLFAEWRAMEPARVLSLVLRTGRHAPEPFAVLGLANTGQARIAQAALLARNHNRFGRDLARAAIMIRKQMPEFCNTHGIHRVEARSHAAHPTAAIFLRRCGFRHECDMPGFGEGRHVFRQFAWTQSSNDNPKE